MKGVAHTSMAAVKKLFAYTTVFLLLSVSYAPSVLAYEETFQYDGNGNLIQDGRFHYEYNGRNMLKRVRLGNETGRILEEYKYRHDGQRGLKVVYNEDGSNKTTLYLNKEWEVKFNETGHKENIHYVFANGERVAKIYENGSKIYYLNDHLGSSSVLVNEDGDVIDRIKYRPFGAVRIGDNVSQYGYNSKELDDTGLLYYGARYYNPQLRRWTQADNVIPVYLEPQSLNRYAYVLNNPLVYTDPDGNIYHRGVKRSIGKFVEGIGNIGQGVTFVAISPFTGKLMPATAGYGGVNIIDGMYEASFSIGTGIQSLLVPDDNPELHEIIENEFIFTDHVSSVGTYALLRLTGSTEEEAVDTTDKTNKAIDGVQFVLIKIITQSDSPSTEEMIVLILDDETDPDQNINQGDNSNIGVLELDIKEGTNQGGSDNKDDNEKDKAKDIPYYLGGTRSK